MKSLVRSFQDFVELSPALLYSAVMDSAGSLPFELGRVLSFEVGGDARSFIQAMCISS